MAFTSQYYRRYLGDKAPMPYRMENSRSALLDTIQSYRPTADINIDNLLFTSLLEIFSAIAQNAVPIPSFSNSGLYINFLTPTVSMHQIYTNHCQEHRPHPVLSGQQFVLDAYTNSTRSYRYFK